MFATCRAPPVRGIFRRRPIAGSFNALALSTPSEPRLFNVGRVQVVDQAHDLGFLHALPTKRITERVAPGGVQTVMIRAASLPSTIAQSVANCTVAIQRQLTILSVDTSENEHPNVSPSMHVRRSSPRIPTSVTCTLVRVCTWRRVASEC